MNNISVSKFELILEICHGKASKPDAQSETIRCELKRHLSPRAVGQIMRSLPLHGSAHVFAENMLYLETQIDSGIERPRRSFVRGEIAFLPSNGIIGFFLADMIPGKTMSPIGLMLDDVAPLRKIKPSDELLFYSTG